MKPPFTSLERDLFCRVECTCLDPRWVDNPQIAHLFKRTITLTGYNDAFFFQKANAEPRQGKCQCGREFKYQWFQDGVEFEFLPTERHHE